MWDATLTRYSVELCVFAVLVLLAVAWHIRNLGCRVQSLETGMKGLATSKRLEEICGTITAQIAQLQTDDQLLRETSQEAMKAWRALTDQQFAVIGQLSQRMDLYLADELRRTRSARPASVLEPAA